ncbi:MAG: class I SAM-dependent methyltransferase [Candidatus Hodarchaeales archaeon]
MKLPLSQAEEARLLLKEARILNVDKKIIRDKEYVYFPIDNKEKLDEILSDFVFQILEADFPLKRKKVNISNILKIEFPEEPWEEISLKFDQIGSICLLRLNPEITTKEFRVRTGQLIVNNQPKIKTAVNKLNITSGIERIYPIEYLSGVKNFKSWHREYGVYIKVDLEKAYFNPRLAEEHRRLSLEIKKGERILDLFTGVGPFALLCAKAVECQVYAVDINPYAITCLKESIHRNKLKGEIYPITGDSSKILKVNNTYNRIIINLPGKSIDYLELAVNLVKKNGFINFYQFIDKVKSPIQIMESLIEEKLKNNQMYKIQDIQVGREVSPSKIQMNVSIHILGE